jgi:hypothetical protein
MHRLGAVDFVTLGRLARVRAEADRRPDCRTGLGLRIRPLGLDRLASAIRKRGEAHVFTLGNFRFRRGILNSGAVWACRCRALTADKSLIAR